jgi:solute carrier family 25 citrate transporter 1
MSQLPSHTSHGAAQTPETRSNPEKQKMTFLQSLVTGSLAGVTEVMIDHPLFVLKLFVQTDKENGMRRSYETRLQHMLRVAQYFRADPVRLLYRGLTLNLLSMTPITAAQVGLNTFFQKACFGDRPISGTEKIITAFAAGAGSALISGPAERIMTLQNSNPGPSFISIGKTIWEKGGVRSLAVGTPGTMGRDGLFSAFFLAGMPLLKDLIRTHLAPTINTNAQVTVLAGTTSGVLATILSHGFDTVKAKQQACSFEKPALSFLKSAKEIYAEAGISGFTKGMPARGARVVSAITIIGTVTEKMTSFFEKGALSS